MVRLEKYEMNAKAKAICKSNKTDKLNQLIADFMSDSNGKRSDAKSIFENCVRQPCPEVFANKLYQVLSSSLDHNSCFISAILLLKSLITKFDTPFLRFPPEEQFTLKRDLLKLVDTSVDTPTRPINKELCHTVSALAASLLPKKEWPEFLPFLFQLITSDKKRALLIGAHLAQYLGKGLKELHSVNLYSELNSVILNKLHPVNLTEGEGEGEDVRIVVWGAAINFILCLEQNDLVNFQDLLTAMMSTLKKALLYSGNETMVDDNTLKLLINLAGMKPTFFRKQIVEMVKKILMMADDHSLEKGTRRLAIEFVLTLVQFVFTLAEVEKTNPRLLKLGTEFEINMQEMWEGNGETDYWSWRGCVDRLRILSHKNRIWTVAFEVLPAYLAAPKEQRHRAALIALSKSIITWNCRECLLKEKEWDVRVAALGAAINFIQCPDLLTSMLSVLENVLEDRDEAMAIEVLELLTKLVEPRFLVGQIEEWVKRIWQIANNDSLNVATRRLAIEFLLKLAPDEEIAPWLQQNVRNLFEILMNMLDYINDYDPNADYVSAWERSNNWRWRCLGMLFIVVGRNDMYSVVLEVLSAYLDAPEWQKKYSAFIVLAESIESCCEVSELSFL
ncbi:unnamed protein product [Ilex paraguariensis]|uniref:IPO4/5-like TPR repeats domain-containing protein n=1 Tax=Ilex paraguariensis TaxID=185542 RepID=A0ABC8US87_9AQUA